MLVSLAQAKAHLRSDTDDGDADLELKIRGASKAVIEYIRNGADSFTDSAGDVLVDTSGEPIGIPEDVKIATLFLIGYFDNNRASDDKNAFEGGWLPGPVRALLAPGRDPPLA